MPRRRRVGGQPSDVDLFESGSIGHNTSETVRTGGGLRGWLAIACAALAVIAVAALALTSTGESESADTGEEDARAALSGEDELSAETLDGPLRSSEPRFGDGPGLFWERILWPIDTPDLRWMNGAFVADNGVTEWTIRPAPVGPIITQRASVLLDHPDHYRVDAEGGRVLAPRIDQPDHLLFFDVENRMTRIELPVKAPVTDLITRRARIDVAVVGDTAVVVIERTDSVNPETLGPRIGVDLTDRRPRIRSIADDLSILVSDPGSDVQNGIFTIPVADTDLSATELEALTPGAPTIEMYAVDLVAATTGPAGVVPDISADVGVAGNRFVLEWRTGDFATHVSTSTTGRSWRPSANRIGVTGLDGDGRSIVGVEDATRDVARSLDGGATWLFTPEPIAKYDVTAVGDVIALRSLASGQDGFETGIDYSLDLDDYELIIGGGGRTYQLLDPETGDIVADGVISDTASGAAFDPFGAGLALSDPATGDELSVSQTQLWMAFATAGSGVATPQELAFTRWSSSADPEWRRESIDGVFGEDARRVEFVGGDGHILAVVATTEGLDFHLAEIS